MVQNLDRKTTREIVAAESGESHEQVRRYIRLTNLVPELLDLVDEGKIKMRPAVELSYLDEDSQRAVVDQIDLNQCTPSHEQTIRMRKFFTDGKLTPEVVSAIMGEEKPNQREKIVLRGDKVRSLIPKNIPISQTEDYVVKALDITAAFFVSGQSVTADRHTEYVFCCLLPHTPSPENFLTIRNKLSPDLSLSL